MCCGTTRDCRPSPSVSLAQRPLQSQTEPLWTPTAITKEDVDDQKNRDGKLSRVIAAQKPWTWAAGPDEGMTPRFYHGSSRGLVLNQVRPICLIVVQANADYDKEMTEAKCLQLCTAKKVLPAIIRRGFPDKVHRSVVSLCPAASCSG